MITQTGIRCKEISFYRRDLAKLWRFIKTVKILNVMLDIFESYLVSKGYRILIRA